MNILKATKRSTTSSGQVNKLRSDGFIPAILYGGKKNNLNIKWKGWINYTELAPHFSEADIGLCILQDSERYMKAIATKIFEYLIMGLPVVTSKGHMSDKLINELMVRSKNLILYHLQHFSQFCFFLNNNLKYHL